MRFRLPRLRLWMLMLLVAVSAGVAWVKLPELDPAYRVWRTNRQIRGQLDRRITLTYPEGISLEQLLIRVKNATKGRTFPSGVPIYVDPVGLQEANLRMGSPVKVAVTRVPLGEALRVSLNRVGLSYMVKDGLVTITATESLDEDL